MTWQKFEDIDPTYSGYAWVRSETKLNVYDPPRVFMARIWTYDKKSSDSWDGWDVDMDERFAMNPFFNHYEVMLLEKPQ